MQKTDFFTLTASASVTNKKENQDSHEVLPNGLIVTDGLGSFTHAKTAAHFVAGFLKNELSSRLEHDASGLFAEAKNCLIEIARVEHGEEEKSDSKDNNRYGTTAIAVVDSGEELIGAYVGNGGLWHIRGNFNEFPSPYLFPWNAVNYLNPHSIPVNGKEALFKLISDNEEMAEATPTVIRLSKDNYFGDIIMICSDGIYSADQFDGGTNSKGVWVKFEETMLSFFHHLTLFFSSSENFNKQSLEEFLNSYLISIKSIIDDDATLAVYISREALIYNFEKIEKGKVIESQREIEAILKAESLNTLNNQAEQTTNELNNGPEDHSQ